jgi:DNA polymerase
MDRADALALLEWYVAMGVDEALSDEGVDRFAASRPPPAAPVAITQPLTPAAPQGDAIVRSAREIATACRTLDDLRAALQVFEGCPLRATASRLVFADGTPGARLMLIGEAPGKEEDAQGTPFVGRSGQLLDRMLAAIGLDRTAVYIANVVPWRPPGNRTPTPAEVQMCLPFIRRQIALAEPEMVLFLGGAAATALTGATEGILRLRGRWLTYRGEEREWRALPTLHPAYLLRNPIAKRLAWQDLLQVKHALEQALPR